MRRHLTTGALALLLILSASVPAPAAAGGWPDISGHWAKGDITAAADQGLIKGYPDGSFRPDGTITRAEFVKLAVLSRGLTPIPGNGSFTDLENHWLNTQGFIQAAVQGSLIVHADYGPDWAFTPDKPITRLEVAVIASRVLGLQAAGWSLRGAPLPFADAEAIPHWASGSVAAVRSAGVLAGYPDGSFGGGRTVTRAEAVVVANRLIARRDRTEVPVWEANSWAVSTVPGLERSGYSMSGVATAPDGTVYLLQGTRIWQIPPGGEPSLLADVVAGSAIAASADGLFVAETGRIWRVTPGGGSEIWAGGAEPGDSDGHGEAAGFRYVQDMCAGPGGELYVIESSPGRIRQVGPDRAVRTLATESQPGSGPLRPVDGPAGEATVYLPNGCAVDPAGNLYFQDVYPGRAIRKLAPDGSISWHAGYRWWFGYADGTREEARFLNITGLALDEWGNLWIADESSNRIRRISPDGHVHTVAGSGYELEPGAALFWKGGEQDGPGPAAMFQRLSGIAVAGGKLYVSQNGGALLRVISGSTAEYETSAALNFVPLAFGNRVERPPAVPMEKGGGYLPLAMYTPVVQTFLEVNGNFAYQSPPDTGGTPPPLSPYWQEEPRLRAENYQLRAWALLPSNGRIIEADVVTGRPQ